MLSVLRQNLMLKLIALVTAIMIWAYVGAERNSTKQVVAEVQRTGTPADDVVVSVGPDSVPVEISGPKSEIENVAPNAVKAIVDVAEARPGTKRLRIARFIAPPGAPHIDFREQVLFVPVEVSPKARKRMSITVSYNNEAPFGREFAQPRVTPPWADVVGRQEDVRRVASLVVYANTEDGSVRADLPIKPLDKDGVVVDTVRTEPETTHVELDLVEAEATRTLVVSVPTRGQPPAPLVVTDIVAEPAQVVVTGKPDVVRPLTHIATATLDLEGLRGNTTRRLTLDLPPGVTVKGRRTAVDVSVRVRDTSRPAP